MLLFHKPSSLFTRQLTASSYRHPSAEIRVRKKAVLRTALHKHFHFYKIHRGKAKIDLFLRPSAFSIQPSACYAERRDKTKRSPASALHKRFPVIKIHQGKVKIALFLRPSSFILHPSAFSLLPVPLIAAKNQSALQRAHSR